MIKAILFDYYGVLRPDIYEQWLMDHGLKRQGDYQQISQDLDANVITREEFYDKLSVLSNIPSENISSYFYTQPLLNPLVYTLLDTLKIKYKLGIISNGSVHTRKRLTEDKLLPYFDSVIISAEIGLVKPDEKIYLYTLGELRASVDEIVYIDDNQENISTAQSLGIQSYLFDNIHNLQNYFKQIF